MMFGQDFFKILNFVMAALRLFARIFGDDDDKKNDDAASSNHSHEIDEIINTTPGAKSSSLKSPRPGSI